MTTKFKVILVVIAFWVWMFLIFGISPIFLIIPAGLFSIGIISVMIYLSSLDFIEDDYEAW